MLDTWLREAVAFQLCIEPNTIKDESDLIELGADSLDIVELIMEIEEEYDILIPDDKITTSLTFGGLKALINATTGN